MFHPIAETHHRLEPVPETQRNEEESEDTPTPKCAKTWTPLPLGEVEREPSTVVFASQLTPFRTELPTRVPEKYIELGRGDYALYALVHLSRDDIYDILQVIKRSSIALGSHAPKVVRAPIYDFCSDNKTVRDLYEYHVSLLDGRNKDIAGGRFIIAAHADWETQGVLIADFDCQPSEPGKIGMMRVNVAALPLYLMRLEESNRNWTQLKAEELDNKWSAPIVGYSGSRWNYYGYEYHAEKWLKGNYGVSRRAT